MCFFRINHTQFGLKYTLPILWTFLCPYLIYFHADISFLLALPNRLLYCHKLLFLEIISVNIAWVLLFPQPHWRKLQASNRGRQTPQLPILGKVTERAEYPTHCAGTFWCSTASFGHWSCPCPYGISLSTSFSQLVFMIYDKGDKDSDNDDNPIYQALTVSNICTNTTLFWFWSTKGA